MGEAHSGGFELSFAAFLEAAPDVAAFAKNYLDAITAEAVGGGFKSPRYDFVFVDQQGFDQHAPATFTALATSFTDFKAGP